ncbi:unnamed protein product [Lymnaea stagnalis]|uniref:beta-N-acetylhexosaminidase n=1 Tax=Lymnaea stagnalis TaxID=6523 RepID=A0AAV2HQX4_LYMST
MMRRNKHDKGAGWVPVSRTWCCCLLVLVLNAGLASGVQLNIDNKPKVHQQQPAEVAGRDRVGERAVPVPQNADNPPVLLEQQNKERAAIDKLGQENQAHLFKEKDDPIPHDFVIHKQADQEREKIRLQVNEREQEQSWLKEMHKKSQAKLVELQKQAELTRGQDNQELGKKPSVLQQNHGENQGDQLTAHQQKGGDPKRNLGGRNVVPDAGHLPENDQKQISGQLNADFSSHKFSNNTSGQGNDNNNGLGGSNSNDPAPPSANTAPGGNAQLAVNDTLRSPVAISDTINNNADGKPKVQPTSNEVHLPGINSVNTSNSALGIPVSSDNNNGVHVEVDVQQEQHQQQSQQQAQQQLLAQQEAQQQQQQAQQQQALQQQALQQQALQQQAQQQQAQQSQQHPPQIGGINLSWDWEDFSIMFNNYGAAEMKVRRSPHPTTGEPWPMPQYYSKKDNKVYKLSQELHFVPTGVQCKILDEAIVRHLQRTLRGSVEDMYDNLQHADGTNIEDPALRYEKEEFLKASLITRVEVKVRKPCDKYPSLESDESYDLVVKKKKTYIWANEVWGALRGLETFGQLVWRGTDGLLYIKETVISDYPRFPHRGLHVDTSRHFLFKEVLLDILESMEMNKLNVFHWHIVDDQSFPYASQVYPELSKKGAFHPTYVYTLEDIAEIIEYARLRGIRVMPEFDSPGHTYSWGLSRPELLTQCFTGNTPVKGYLGPIDPSKNATYRFLQSLFQEIVDVFKDDYLHLGGDEVPLGCWQSNPEVMAFAAELAKQAHLAQQQQPQQPQQQQQFQSWSMWSDDVKRVYEYYENRLIQILNDIGQKRKKAIKYVMWQEVMNNNLQLPNDTIIQVWMGDMGDVMRATSLGYQVLYSTCWYMDHIEYGTKWPKYYNCDPVDASYGYHIDEKKVLGGEAAFWSEYFTNENLIPMMWPRASAAAERLWSNKDVKNLERAAERLAEHRCRMIKRGINAGEINGPGYCLHAPPKRRLFNDTVGCQGNNCSRTILHIEDIQLTLSQKGGSLAECSNFFTKGGVNFLFILIASLVALGILYVLTRPSSRLHRSRICKNRTILLGFVVVLLVYFLCYTTIWMRGFEFSGSFHKTLQEDNRSGVEGEGEHRHRHVSTS